MRQKFRITIVRSFIERFQRTKGRPKITVWLSLTPDPERSAKGGNGMSGEGKDFAALRRRLSLRKLKREGNRRPPTLPCARCEARYDMPRPTVDKGRRNR
jgi:hypothetical protein